MQISISFARKAPKIKEKLTVDLYLLLESRQKEQRSTHLLEGAKIRRNLDRNCKISLDVRFRRSLILWQQEQKKVAHLYNHRCPSITNNTLTHTQLIIRSNDHHMAHTQSINRSNGHNMTHTYTHSHSLTHLFTSMTRRNSKQQRTTPRITLFSFFQTHSLARQLSTVSVSLISFSHFVKFSRIAKRMIHLMRTVYTYIF